MPIVYFFDLVVMIHFSLLYLLSNRNTTNVVDGLSTEWHSVFEVCARVHLAHILSCLSHFFNPLSYDNFNCSGFKLQKLTRKKKKQIISIIKLIELKLNWTNSFRNSCLFVTDEKKNSTVEMSSAKIYLFFFVHSHTILDISMEVFFLSCMEFKSKWNGQMKTKRIKTNAQETTKSRAWIEILWWWINQNDQRIFYFKGSTQLENALKIQLMNEQMKCVHCRRCCRSTCYFLS